MYLVVAATEMELARVRENFGSGREEVDFLITGIGPVEAALHTTRYLAVHGKAIDGVVHCGVAGAYEKAGLAILDTFLVNEEILAELGICTGDDIEDFDADTLDIRRVVNLENRLYARASKILAQQKISYVTGRMLTVSCVSGTAKRGDFLSGRFQAMGECMEGAAVARVCEEFAVDCIELRSISNMVEDRDPDRWRLAEACAENGQVVAGLLEALVGRRGGEKI